MGEAREEVGECQNCNFLFKLGLPDAYVNKIEQAYICPKCKHLNYDDNIKEFKTYVY